MYNQLFKEFAYTLDSLESNNNEVIITGVFNIDLLKLNNKTKH